MSDCSFESALLAFNANPQFKASINGAASAWRGYELQTLYICSRIDFSLDDHTEFWPESAEDLLVHRVDEDGTHIELVQVKAMVDTLSLSDIAPRENNSQKGKSDSLFGHVCHFAEMGFDVRARVVVFGRLGVELKGFADNDMRARGSVLRKVSHMFGEDIARFAETRLVLEEVDEGDLRERLGRSAAGRVELSAWPAVYLQHLTSKVRDCSLGRRAITRGQIEQDIVDLGLRLAGLGGFARRYGSSIVPLSRLFVESESERGREEYRNGVNARPEHIVSCLDAPRPMRMKELEDALVESQIVLVRGASGQGKSTLCYRYLYDRVPAGDCYLITEVDSLEVAADICSFLVALSEANHDRLQYAYVDGAREDGWVWLAEQLTFRASPNIKLIASIREEDLSRANLSAKQFTWSDVVLRLEESEARELFASYGETRFPSFEESWMSFGKAGPLMEYTYSLSTGSTLRSMLSSQLGRIVESWDDSWVYALYLSSLIGAEGVETSLAELSKSSGCGSMAAFVKAVEREHLMRGAEKGLIAPLHPYRSLIVAELLELYIFRSSREVALDLVKCAASSCGTLLVALHARSGGFMPDGSELAAAAEGSWHKASEILKYALWSDAREVYEDCRDVRMMIAEYNLATWLFFAFGGGITKFFEEPARDAVLDLVADDTIRLKMDELFESASRYRTDYRHTLGILASVDVTSMPFPLSPRQLTFAGFTLAQFVACGCVSEDVTEAAQRLADRFEPDGRSASSELDFALGLQLCGARLRDGAYDVLRGAIDESHMVLWSKSDWRGVDIIQVPCGKERDLNDELVLALADYRRLYPSAESYNGVQVGTDAFVPAEKMTPVQKHIPQKNLPIRWMNVADIMFYAMCNYDDAPLGWNEIEGIVSSTLGLLHEAIVGVIRWLDKAHEKGMPTSISEKTSRSVLTLAQRSGKIWTTVDIPRSDRDPLGFKSLVSPVDPRVERSVDSDAVSFNKPSANPLAATAEVLVNAETLGQRLADLVLSITRGDRKQAEMAARRGTYFVSEIVKSLAPAEGELECVYKRSLLPAETEKDLVILSEVLGHYSAHGLRREHGVAYEAKLRAGRLMNVQARVADFANAFDGVRAEVHQGGLVLRVALDEIGYPSVEALLGDMISRQCSGFDAIANITEFYLFPYYLEPIELDIYEHGEYCATVGLSGHQLERMAQEGSDYEVIYQPVPESDRVLPVTDDPCAVALKNVMAIAQLGRFVTLVKAGIRNKDRELISLDGKACAKWVDEMRADVLGLIRQFRERLDDLGPLSLSWENDLDRLSQRLMESYDIRDPKDPYEIAMDLRDLVEPVLSARTQSLG